MEYTEDQYREVVGRVLLWVDVLGQVDGPIICEDTDTDIIQDLDRNYQETEGRYLRRGEYSDRKYSDVVSIPMTKRLRNALNVFGGDLPWVLIGDSSDPVLDYDPTRDDPYYDPATDTTYPV